jgi:hypothetical protein
VGSALGQTFSTLFKHPFVFVGLSFLALLPSVLISVFTRTSMGSNVIDTIMGLVIQGAVVYGVFQVLRGDAASLGGSLAHGMARAVPLFLTSLSVGLPILASVLLLVLVVGLVFGRAAGTILAVLAGLALYCRWFVAIPVCVVERLGPIDSMNRSRALTQGCRLKIFGVFLLTLIIAWLCRMGGNSLVALAPRHALSPFRLPGPLSLFFSAFIYLLATAIPTALNYVMSAIVYYDLRAAREGVTLDSLANVFD